MKKLLLSSLLLLSCGTEQPKDPTITSNHLTQLRSKYTTYLNQVSNVQDNYGFIESDHCDSVLFTGLLSIATGTSILSARNSDGQWFRRPTMDCYPNNSRSTISRDMFIGIFWNLWRNKDLSSLNSIWEYGERTNWKMGEGVSSRVFLTPNMISTLGILIHSLGGEDHLLRKTPLSMGDNTGFAAHLDVLLLTLRAEALGYLEKPSIISTHYNRNCKNALFAYTYNKYISGNHYSTTIALLNTQYFPVDRLPTSSDRKAAWLWERDDGADWLPSTTDLSRQHSGGDYLFITKLLLDDI